MRRFGWLRTPHLAAIAQRVEILRETPTGFQIRAVQVTFLDRSLRLSPGATATVPKHLIRVQPLPPPIRSPHLPPSDDAA